MKFDNLANKLLNSYIVEKQHMCAAAAEGCDCDECEECRANAHEHGDSEQSQEQ